MRPMCCGHERIGVVLTTGELCIECSDERCEVCHPKAEPVQKLVGILAGFLDAYREFIDKH
jgi:hypothetical protein